MSRAELEAWDREIVWHAFTQMAEYVPWIIESAEGCWLTDLDGRRYLDGVSSLWCNVHGHRHPKLDAALQQQLSRVAHVTSLGMSNPTTIACARRLTELAPTGLHHVFFSDNGATAVEVALKMAFQYWQQRANPRPAKTRFMAFEQAYHGDTLGSVSVGGVARFHQMFRPLLFDAIRLPIPDTYRRPVAAERLSQEELTAHYLVHVEQALEQHAAETAALVIEPLVQGAAGMVMHPPGFLRGVRELTQRHDVLLIADEVAVGMGRLGTLFACEQETVAPDFLCLAKGLTGGYLPFAATLATTPVWQAFLGDYAESKTFFHGHTYGGNPLGAALTLANLEIFEQEQTLLQMPAKQARLASHLDRLTPLPYIGSVRQRGLLAAVELVLDKSQKSPFPWHEKRGMQVCDRLREAGVWLRPLGNVLVVMPPLAITPAEIDWLGDTLYRVLEDWCAQLPAATA